MDKLLGLVLCGGESRRMGSDKGLLLKDGIPWALHMGQKLSPWKIPVFYSINSGQHTAYKTILPERHLVIDSLNLPGPLNGLFSLHQRLPKTDILLLACDMIDLDEATINGLISEYRQGGQDFYAYGVPGNLQPFCCIYTAAALQKAWPLLLAGQLHRYSLQSLLRTGKVSTIEILKDEAFANYNSI